MEDVAVAGVVEGGERAEDGGGVGGGAGDEVGEARRERGGGWDWERKKLGLDEGVRRRMGGGGGEEKACSEKLTESLSPFHLLYLCLAFFWEEEKERR